MELIWKLVCNNVMLTYVDPEKKLRGFLKSIINHRWRCELAIYKNSVVHPATIIEYDIIEYIFF